MDNRRSKRLADQIHAEISTLIDRKLKDPAIGFVTITAVRLSSDLRLANIQITSLKDGDSRESTLKGLKRAVPFLRSELASRLKVRYVPELRFFYDESMEYAHKINELLHRIHEEDDR